MTLTITDHGMTSDHTPHTARPAPDRQHAWQVSWCCAALRMPMKAALAVPMWGR